MTPLTAQDTLLFNGQFFNRNARNTKGLYYLRARYYDPETGTFMTRDPLAVQLPAHMTQRGELPAVMNPQPLSSDLTAPRPGSPEAALDPGTLHPYSYSVSNPTNRTDPSGRCRIGLWSWCGTFPSINFVTSNSPTAISLAPGAVNIWPCKNPCDYDKRPALPPGMQWVCAGHGPPGTSFVCSTVAPGGDPLVGPCEGAIAKFLIVEGGTTLVSGGAAKFIKLAPIAARVGWAGFNFTQDLRSVSHFFDVLDKC